MDKETLSNYGWIVVLVLILAVMLALATPFGTFIAGAIKSTTAGLFSVNQAALGSAGIDVNDMVFENCDHLETEVRNATDTYTGDTCCKTCGAVLQAGQTVRAKVPEGGKYTAADGTVYNPGDEMPENVMTGDLYTYKDYEYKYNYRIDSGNYWSKNEIQNGWGVDVAYMSVTHGPVLESINGMPITNMDHTYLSDTMVQNVPDTIPSTVTSMFGTFKGCKIINAPAIPSGVTNMEDTFANCSFLTSAPDVGHCTKLTNMEDTFAGCTSLKTYHSSTDADGDFSNYLIPNSVEDMYWTFWKCTSITSAPEIPNSVKDMGGTFKACTSLVGTIIINANPEKYSTCFDGVDMTNITLTGSASKNILNLIGATGNNWTPIS